MSLIYLKQFASTPMRGAERMDNRRARPTSDTFLTELTNGADANLDKGRPWNGCAPRIEKNPQTGEPYIVPVHFRAVEDVFAQLPATAIAAGKDPHFVADVAPTRSTRGGIVFASATPDVDNTVACMIPAASSGFILPTDWVGKVYAEARVRVTAGGSTLYSKTPKCGFGLAEAAAANADPFVAGTTPEYCAILFYDQTLPTFWRYYTTVDSDIIDLGTTTCRVTLGLDQLLRIELDDSKSVAKFYVDDVLAATSTYPIAATNHPPGLFLTSLNACKIEVRSLRLEHLQNPL